MTALVRRLHAENDSPEHDEAIRIVEALLFAAAAPMSIAALAARLPAARDVPAILHDLERAYASRGVNLVEVAGGWAFRTAADLSFALAEERHETQKLSRAGLEVLAIIAYHQPTTRAEIEEIRGVSTSKGTLDTLLELGWVRLRGRRKSPGRPVTFGTTAAFLEQFGLKALTDLPGLDDMKGLGLIEGRLPAWFDVPRPDDGALRDDEEPLDADLSSVGSGDLGDE